MSFIRREEVNDRRNVITFGPCKDEQQKSAVDRAISEVTDAAQGVENRPADKPIKIRGTDVQMSWTSAQIVLDRSSPQFLQARAKIETAIRSAGVNVQLSNEKETEHGHPR